MCGIAGIVSRDKNFDFGQIEKFDRYLKRRGPDDRGSLKMENCCFFHRRLSIVDLSLRGRQPFLNENGTIMSICNGEIYNYKKLRKKLVLKGHRLRSFSDNEVLVHLYEEYGEKFIDYVEGEFAMAIWDNAEKKLLIFRDRFGVKPVYYLKKSKTFFFSSDFASLADNFVPKREIDIEALNHFVIFRYVPAPDTIIKGIKKLPGGCYLRIRSGSVELIRYHHLLYNIKKISEAKAVQELRKKISSAVQSRLMSDVPLGVFLSGGIDSSILVSEMHDLGIRKIKTYSIGFQNEKNETSNEFYFSDIIAKKFKTDHRKIVMSEDDFYDSLDEWIEAMGEPIGAPAAVSLFWLSRIASREVKVILNGQGADENFGGYEWYKIMRKMFDFDHAPSQFLEYYAGIKEFEKNRLLNDSFRRYDVSLRKVKEVYKSYVNSGQRDGLSATCHLDFHFGLPEVGLKEVDAVSMHFGLESRVPYLDCDLVNFCCMLPENLKIRALNEKYILKKANRKKLPEEILGRKKLGFPVPVATWYQAKMGKMIKETLLSKHSLARGIFNEEELRKFLYQEERSSDCSRNKTFRFFVLELWMRRFMDS